MLTVRSAEDRGNGWLDTHYTFSFSDYDFSLQICLGSLIRAVPASSYARQKDFARPASLNPAQ